MVSSMSVKLSLILLRRNLFYLYVLNKLVHLMAIQFYYLFLKEKCLTWQMRTMASFIQSKLAMCFPIPTKTLCSVTGKIHTRMPQDHKPSLYQLKVLYSMRYCYISCELINLLGKNFSQHKSSFMNHHQSFMRLLGKKKYIK